MMAAMSVASMATRYSLLMVGILAKLEAIGLSLILRRRIEAEVNSLLTQKMADMCDIQGMSGMKTFLRPSRFS
jgi:hypothetical protein